MVFSQCKKILMNIMVVLVLSITMFGILEGVVRLRQYIKYGFAGIINDIYYTDPGLQLRVLIPHTKQGNIHINSLGFRSPEVINPKPDSLIRLAFLGGSTTFCAEVSNDTMTWPHLVWKRLQTAKPDVQFDYVNAAVPGYTLTAMSKIFQYRVQSLNPDIIIIYEAANDLSMDTRKLAFEQGLIQQSTIDNESWLARYSLLWFLLEKNYIIWQRQREAVRQIAKLQFDPCELSQGFQKRLHMLVDECQQTAGLVAVATFSYKLRREQSPEEQIQAANTALYYMPYMSIEGLLSGYEEYNRVIRTVTAETKTLLIDEEMSIPGDALHFNDSVHFKDAGSQLMAKRVSEHILNSEAFESLVKLKQRQR